MTGNLFGCLMVLPRCQASKSAELLVLRHENAVLRRQVGWHHRRRLDGETTERVIFALVAQRALEPGSKLAATRWVAERVAVEGCAGFSEDAAYAAMDFLLDALGGIASQIFSSVAHLLNLDLDIVFVDTTSAYWECGVADELAELAEEAADDEVSVPEENAARVFGHSKDHRDDLPVSETPLPASYWRASARGWLRSPTG